MNNKKLEQEQVHNQQQEDRIDITYYTDPLCCWSWAFEAQWRRLRYEFSGKLKFRYRMGGMLPNWTSYNDPLNSIDRPLQMGPLWLEAKYTTGMPIEDKIWSYDPPSSSYPACMAVKCAGLQSGMAEELYLRKVREAIMLEGKNIAKQEVLLEVAEKLNEESPAALDVERFKEDLKANAAADAFREDIQKSRYHSIGRFPTLTLQKPGETGVIITGYRPYEVLVDALRQVESGIEPVQRATDEKEYREYWGSITDHEVKEAVRRETREPAQ